MEHVSRQHRIQRWSTDLGFGLCVMAVFVPLMTIINIATMSGQQFAGGAEIASDLVMDVSLQKRIAIIILTSIPALIFSCALLALLPALNDLRQAQFFSDRVVRALKRFGMVFFVATIVKLFVVPATGLILSIGEAHGSISIRIGLDTFQSVFVAIGVWVFAWIIAEASAVAAENRKFV